MLTFKRVSDGIRARERGTRCGLCPAGAHVTRTGPALGAAHSAAPTSQLTRPGDPRKRRNSLGKRQTGIACGRRWAEGWREGAGAAGCPRAARPGFPGEAPGRTCPLPSEPRGRGALQSRSALDPRKPEGGLPVSLDSVSWRGPSGRRASAGLGPQSPSCCLGCRVGPRHNIREEK